MRSWACPAPNRRPPKRGGDRAKALCLHEGLDHEEVKAQEGMASCQDTNHGLATGSIFTRTKALKTTKDVGAVFPRYWHPCLTEPQPGTEAAQPAGRTSRGHTSGDEPLGLREGSNPLEGATPRMPPI
jgi:hypothetical protein